MSRFEDIFKKSWEQNEVSEEINEEDEGLTANFSLLLWNILQSPAKFACLVATILTILEAMM